MFVSVASLAGSASRNVFERASSEEECDETRREENHGRWRDPCQIRAGTVPADGGALQTPLWTRLVTQIKYQNLSNLYPQNYFYTSV